MFYSYVSLVLYDILRGTCCTRDAKMFSFSKFILLFTFSSAISMSGSTIQRESLSAVPAEAIRRQITIREVGYGKRIVVWVQGEA